MPTRKVPRFMISSSREAGSACAAAASKNAVRRAKIRIIGISLAQTSGHRGHRPASSFRETGICAPRSTRPANSGNARRPALNLDVVFPGQSRGRAASEHLGLERFKLTPRLALAVVDEPDGGVAGHRPADDRRGVLADGFVHIILAIIGATDGPFETDRRHRAGANPGVAVRGVPLRGDRCLYGRGFLNYM